MRACSRYGEEYAGDARAFLESVALLPLDEGVLVAATALQPAELRSLDAIHLATALSAIEEVGVFVTYDQRLAAAASAHGFAVVAPGA